MAARTGLDQPEIERLYPELATADPEEVLAWAYRRFSQVAIVASFQVESSVLIDMACRIRDRVEVITLDTGRLPQETYEIIDTFQQRYPVQVKVVSPDPEELAEMTGRHGVNLFYRSPELRIRCCEIRKSRPLARALRDYDAWVTGLRRDQSPTRAATPVVARDESHGGIVKLAPLATWTADQVWDYVRRHQVPYHPLHDRGYPSIGCAPCTRPVQPGEDPRAGRWWWEQDVVKECGLHWDPSGRPSRRDKPADRPS
jgi:phosphoadenosine phosphosulfate reductase